MARHVFTVDDCRRGGLARSQQPSFAEMASLGFWACMDAHPFFARKHLRKWIKGDAAHRPVKQGITPDAIPF